MQSAVVNFCKNQDNGMLLIDMPTGTGKTFETRNIIKRFLKNEILTEIPLVVYVTPLKKNIDDIYDDLRDDFKNDKETFDNNVLRIHANYECVLESLLECEEDIQLSLRNKKSFKNLKNKIQAYNRLKDSLNMSVDILSTSLMEIRKDYELKFRRDLEEELSKEGKSLSARKKLLKHDYAWVKKIYPSCLIDDRKVLFMTMDKFISGNDPIINKSYSFLTYPKLSNALVFIDEFDATKDVILNQEIERCTDFKLDMARLFSGIATALKGKEFPVQLFGDTDESRTSFEKMKERILEVEKDYDLNYIFKLESKNDSNRYFLFDDYQLHTITSSKDAGKITFKTDKKKNHNIISIIDKDVKDDGRFYRSIYAMKGALNYFLNCCAMLSKNYMNNFNKHPIEDKKDKMEIEQAVSTIVDPFNLDRNVTETISRMIIDNISLPKDKDIVATDFYMDGFRYYDFKDDMSHDASTSFLMCYMNNTPEKVMLSLADRARVVGLSATASIQTVTGNYNIEYLKDELNEKFYRLQEEDFLNIQNKVKVRLERDYKINVDTKECNLSIINEIVKSIFELETNIEKYTGIFEKYKSDKDDNYQIKRLSKTILAIKSFIINDDSKVLLVLTNKNIKISESNDIFNESLMQEIIESISKENDKVLPKIHHLFGNDFDAEKKAYNDEIREGKKIILFSSYSSVGTGQNLQYEENFGEDIIKKDIDSIYIEYPTNILVQTDNLKEETELIKYIYQMEILKKNGEIAASLSLRNIKFGFKKYNNPNAYYSFDNSAYKSDSVNNHMVKILVQAVGRICRTNGVKKKHNVNIYVDNDIFKNIDFTFMNGRLMNPEFEEIVKLSKKEVVKNKEVNILLNKANECNIRVKKRIENILSINKTSWDENDIRMWKDIREFVLKHPTISKNELSNYIQVSKIRGLKDFYLSAVDGGVIDSYQYLPNYDVNENDKDFFPIQYYIKQQKNYIVINDVECRLDPLMKIPYIRKVFEKKGYATSFAPNELIILPVIYQNIYKGVLGEEVGKIILENHGIHLKEINDASKFEKFDYQLSDDEDVYVDFKNWSENDKEDRNEYSEKSRLKLERINGKKAFIINLVASEFQIKDNDRIVEVSTITKKNNLSLFELDKNNLLKLINKINEAIGNGDN